MKAHTWRVTKLYKVKRQAGLHLMRARAYGTPACVAECTQNYKKAGAYFNRVKDAEVGKVFKKSMDEEAAKCLPELSKKAHRAFKGLTRAKSKHGGLSDMATWRTPQATRVAHGHSDVGDMVSDYTESVNSKACAPGEFDEPFRARAAGLVQELDQDPTLQGFCGNIAMAHPAVA